jgi:hypothetical protein
MNLGAKRADLKSGWFAAIDTFLAVNVDEETQSPNLCVSPQNGTLVQLSKQDSLKSAHG